MTVASASEVAIRVEGLSKSYRIGGKQEKYRTIRDSIAGAISAPARHINSALRRTGGRQANKYETIWALKDVSFEVKRGEVVGVIGRNGAGKSTLLKILSRITEPTGGRVEVRGRVGSLLEVGTGFHPELSGRENIHLNGAILGMRRTEVIRNFDEIVEFAEVSKFIDTPVKHYSSGMYLRLAFSVAAHLESEILLVDEVLAVGDARFQKKCLGKMDQIAKEGRTVLFVSHNLEAVSSLCTRGILLDRGEVHFGGLIHDVIRDYLQMITPDIVRGHRSIDDLVDEPFSITSMGTYTTGDVVNSVFARSDPVSILIAGHVQGRRDNHMIAVDIRTLEDKLLFRTHSFEHPSGYQLLSKLGPFGMRCIIPANLLPAGTYRVGLITAITGERELQNIYPALEFDVFQDELLGGTFVGSRGVLTPHCEWEPTANAH